MNRPTWIGTKIWICGRFELHFKSGAHLLQCHLKLLPEKRPNNSQALQSHKTNKERSSDLSYVSLQSVQHRRCKRGFKDSLVFVDHILRNAISLTTTFLKVAITEKTHQTSAAHLTSKNSLYEPFSMDRYEKQNFEDQFELGSKTGSHLLRCHLKFLPKMIHQS